jgi:hypothetical protein
MNSSIAASTYELFGANIVSELFEGEVVAVNLDSGNYYSIRNTGAYVWNALITQHSLEQIIHALSQTYQQQETNITDEINQFVEALEKEGLLKTTQIADAQTELAAPVGDYVSPTLDTFNDMQEILLLDPVHDVDESGWPVVKP